MIPTVNRELRLRGFLTDYYRIGQLKTPDLVPSNFSFESAIQKLEGEDKRLFLEFVKRMIKWRPQERSTANELLEDPWLYVDFDE